MKSVLSICLLMFFYMHCFAQDFSPKREMRGVWIASVVNIDFPPTGMYNAKDQKKYWIELLDSLQQMGINALFVQVRPVSDALYPSKLEPWSAYLSGKQGKAPDPYYDPLKFMIKEAHKRSMEFHAWLNPYRATFDLKLNLLDEKHPLKVHPEWFLKYGTKYYYKPALPEVRSHINTVIEDLVSRYEVDGIHFDDYFYPYKIKGESFPDSLDFQNLGNGFDNIDDWRRNNVNELIAGIHHLLNDKAPKVKFGVSPFGVWRNQSMDPKNGSATKAGQTTYDDLYADVLKWMKEGWVDYLIPQIYWHIGFDLADHKILSEWWNDNHYNTNIYIGHGAYRIGAHQAEEWNDPNEMPRQIQLNRSLPKLKGSVYFSAKSLLANPLSFSDSLKTLWYQSPAILPAYTNKSTTSLIEINNLRASKRKDGMLLRWASNLKKEVLYYVVYRFAKEEKIDLNASENILYISPYHPKKGQFFDDSIEDGKEYTYVVTGFDAFHNEGKENRVEIPKDFSP
ncbi:MAG: family 10 glycosylhydrolase [Bacteroidota bacterium]